jgi:hypothetical protein
VFFPDPIAVRVKLGYDGPYFFFSMRIRWVETVSEFSKALVLKNWEVTSLALLALQDDSPCCLRSFFFHPASHYRDSDDEHPRAEALFAGSKLWACVWTVISAWPDAGHLLIHSGWYNALRSHQRYWFHACMGTIATSREFRWETRSTKKSIWIFERISGRNARELKTYFSNPFGYLKGQWRKSQMISGYLGGNSARSESREEFMLNRLLSEILRR